MGMSKHTPTPWHLNRLDESTLYLAHEFVETETGRSICGMWNPEDLNIKDSDERKANAKLILAAPDLLEALKDILICFNDNADQQPHLGQLTENQINKAKEAVAKAE
jgi:hypothetical protein